MAECPLLALSGHAELHCTCPLLGVKRTSACAMQMSAFDPKRTLYRPPLQDWPVDFRGTPACALWPAVSIRSVYTYYGTHRQEVAIPPQHGRIKAGRATAVQKQSVLALKLIPEELRELAKRNF